jgi:hypothetical protein
MLRRFGSICYCLTPKEIRDQRPAPKAFIAQMLNIDPDHKAWRVLQLPSKKIKVVRHLICNEQCITIDDRKRLKVPHDIAKKMNAVLLESEAGYEYWMGVTSIVSEQQQQEQVLRDAPITVVCRGKSKTIETKNQTAKITAENVTGSTKKSEATLDIYADKPNSTNASKSKLANGYVSEKSPSASDANENDISTLAHGDEPCTISGRSVPCGSSGDEEEIRVLPSNKKVDFERGFSDDEKAGQTPEEQSTNGETANHGSLEPMA